MNMNIEKITLTIADAADLLAARDGRVPMDPVVRLYPDRAEIESDIYPESPGMIAEIPASDFVDYFCGDMSQYQGISGLTKQDIIDGFRLNG